MAMSKCQSMAEQQFVDLSHEELKSLRKILHEFFGRELPEIVKLLRTFADELDAAYKDIQITNVAGTATSIVGAVLSTVGFGLSFATFGASLSLSIAGGVIAGMGGVTVGGAAIADAVKGSKTRKKAEEHVQKCQKMQEDIIKICQKLEHKVNLQECLAWKEFWWKIGKGSYQAGVGIGYKIVAKSAMTGVRLAKLADLASDVSVSVFRTLSTAGKVLHIAGGVVGAVLLPLDIYTLVSSSRSIHKRQPHEVSKKLRLTIAEIEKIWPSKEEIDEMIDSAIDYTTRKT